MHSLQIRTAAREALLDITPDLEELLRAQGTESGIMTVYTPHTTTGLTINEGADPDVRRDIEPISTAGATPVKLDLVIFQHPDKSFEYAINNVPFMKDHDIPARTGETQIWTLNNKTKWSHPFHLHGFFFQQLDENEKPVKIGEPSRTSSMLLAPRL